MTDSATAANTASESAAYASKNAPVTGARPLSPFMIGPYYKPQLTSMLSITHRLTGIALSMGTLFIAAWVTAAAAGRQTYGTFAGYANGIVGHVMLVAFTWSLMFHLLNGVRHLFWDAGVGLELKPAYASGWSVAIASVVLTAAVWFAALAG